VRKIALLPAARDFARLFFGKRVFRSGAALAYYLTLTVFPALIVVSWVLGTCGIDPLAARDAFQSFLPADTLQTLTDYLRYVGENNSPALLIAGGALLVTTSAAAFRCLTGTMTEIQGRALFSGFWGTLFSFAFSLLFVAAMYVATFAVLTGEWFLQWLRGVLGLPEMLSHWNWLRFLLMFAVLFLVIWLIYRLSSPRGVDHRVAPGAGAAAVAIVVISILFSRFITLSSRYSLVYGSLASVILMMIWLYACSTVLVSGNLLNYVLGRARHGFYADGGKS